MVVLNPDAVEAAFFRRDLLDRRRELMHRWSRCLNDDDTKTDRPTLAQGVWPESDCDDWGVVLARSVDPLRRVDRTLYRPDPRARTVIYDRY